jgi:flagellar biosynthesis chaperone FliJ
MGKASNLIDKINESFDITEYVPMSESQLDKEIKKAISELTSDEVESAEDDINEAKSTFPKAKQIKSLLALRKKYMADVKGKNQILMHYRNDYAQAKDRKSKLAITKKRKAVQAELGKLHDVLKRARVQLDKLEAERKAYNKAKKAKAKNAA